MQQIELLAPAGSFDALKAAVQNGADAVYIGGADFGARAYASNFDYETMKVAVEYAHIRGVKIYVTVNTLMKDDEAKKLIEYISFLYEIDVDAVIVQDLGVFSMIKDIFPDFEVHASTQMTLHNKYGVELLKKMGINRAVLAREMTVEEIKDIYDETGVELEIFVHGALCVSYSGQCLMSSFIGGRSGNRGRCAQPCRKEYNLLNLGKNQVLNTGKAFHLSMRDLNTVEEIGRLIDAGVTSFKIEGRMKKPQYVASIVSAYRKAIDIYIADKESLKDKELEQEMAQMFNRKFTKGYLFSSPKIDVINIEKSNNRGLYLGKVEDYNRNTQRIKVKLGVDLSRGDGIEVWNGPSSDIGGTVINIYINNESISIASAGQSVEIELKGDIKKGDEIYKTLDAGLLDKLERTYAYDKEYKKIPLYGEINVRLDEFPKLYIWDDEGNATMIQSKDKVQLAQKVALTESKLTEQLSKLGNTPFHLANLIIDLEENCSIPASVLNSLRREAVEEIIEKRKNRHKREKISAELIKHKLANVSDEEELELELDNKVKVSGKKLSVKVDTLEQLDAVLNHSIDRVYYGDLFTFKEAIQLCREKNIDIYFRTPSILRDEEYKKLENKIDGLCFDGILAGDLGMIHFNNHHWKLPIIGDFSLNTMNSYSVKSFENLKLKGITLSPELDFKTIRKLSLDVAMEKEAIIYGNMIVMTTEYCPLVHEKQCDQKCMTCSYPKYKYNFGLKDVKDMTFSFGKDSWGRSIILNSQPLFMLDRLKEFGGIDINFFRVELTSETVEEIDSLLSMALQNIESINNKSRFSSADIEQLLDGGYTRGHYYRGVE